MDGAELDDVFHGREVCFGYEFTRDRTNIAVGVVFTDVLILAEADATGHAFVVNDYLFHNASLLFSMGILEAGFTTHAFYIVQ